MAADRVPAKGEVWVLRHLRSLNRGRVTILVDPADVHGRVVYRYRSTGTEFEFGSVAEFVRDYDFLAVDEATADAVHGPQLHPSSFAPTSQPPRLGTDVPLKAVER